jgi:hypothetical protein
MSVRYRGKVRQILSAPVSFLSEEVEAICAVLDEAMAAARADERKECARMADDAAMRTLAAAIRGRKP